MSWLRGTFQKRMNKTTTYGLVDSDNSLADNDISLADNDNQQLVQSGKIALKMIVKLSYRAPPYESSLILRSKNPFEIGAAPLARSSNVFFARFSIA